MTITVDMVWVAFGLGVAAGASGLVALAILSQRKAGRR